MLQKLGGIVVVIAIAGGIFWWKSKQSEKVDARVDEVHEQVMKICEDIPSFNKHADFFAASGMAAHVRAYDNAYTSSGRRRSAKFDEAEYVRLYFKSLIEASERANKADLTTELRQAQINAEKALGIGS